MSAPVCIALGGDSSLNRVAITIFYILTPSYSLSVTSLTRRLTQIVHMWTRADAAYKASSSCHFLVYFSSLSLRLLQEEVISWVTIKLPRNWKWAKVKKVYNTRPAVAVNQLCLSKEVNRESRQRHQPEAKPNVPMLFSCFKERFPVVLNGGTSTIVAAEVAC